jgi:iron complex outermembrane receptor protein
MNAQNPTPISRSHTRILRAGFLLTLPALVNLGFAQTNAPATEPDNDLVTLSPFAVSTSKDVGYRATNSIAGTRTNTPIKDIPLNIQVFTQELAEDLLIKNQTAFEAYNASLVNGGADRASDNAIQQSYQNFLFRGFRQNWGLRDGIREYDPIDTQGLARVEVVKGPAAALYGLAYPGGIMNNISKTVDFARNFTSIRLTAGNEGDHRESIDTNVTGAIGTQKIGIRFNGAYEKSEDLRAHSQGDVRFSAVTLAWQPTKTTTAEFLAEKGYRGKPNGLGIFLTGEAGAAGNEASIPLQVLKPGIPWDWNWSNGVNLDSLDTSLYRGKITQQIGEHFTVQGYVQYASRLEKSNNGWDASGGEYAGSGWDQVTNTIRSTYNYRDWGNQMHSYGATGVYKLDFSQLKDTFAFGTNVWKEDELSRRHTPLNPAASTLIYQVAANIPIAVPPYPPADTVPVMTGAGYHHEDNSNDYYFLSWQASMLDDRLKTNLGINRTNIKTVAWNNGQSMVADNIYESSKNSPLFGAVFAVTKEVSVFVVHSTSLFPDSTKDTFGNQFAPQVGSSWEGGLKVDLMNGKISGTVSYYNIKQTGGTQNDPNQPNVNTGRYDALSPEQRAIQFPAGRPIGDIIAGGEQESKGFDVDLTFQPLRQLQVVTSFAHVDHQFVTSAVPATIGQTYPQAIKDRWAMIAKYSFLEGELKGLALGAGLSGGTKSLQDYRRRAANGDVYSGTGAFIDVARYEPGRTTAELFAIYRFKMFGQNALVQLNVQNILKTPDYIGWKPTGSANKLATERFEVPTPIVYRVSLGMDF